ncbi:MAG: hypothetical protein IJ038_07410 [Clostridia bacterium]|nr:hypothetical protein [Clostridia bacterium]
MKILKSVLSFLLSVLLISAGLIFSSGAEDNADSVVSYYDGTVDLSWYDPAIYKTEYHITSAAQLAGLSALVRNGAVLDKDFEPQHRVFEGVTFYLDCDIVWNTGDASEWGNTAPQYSWEPIGEVATPQYSNFESVDPKDCLFFWGNFDGQGHIISGLYCGDESAVWVGLFSVYCGEYIKNLSVVNSYFTGYSCVGSIAGYALGTVPKVLNANSDEYAQDLAAGNAAIYKNLYSDTLVEMPLDSFSRKRAGGLFGMMKLCDKSSCETKEKGGIMLTENCWVNGTVIADVDSTAGSRAGLITSIVRAYTNSSCYDMIFRNVLATGKIVATGTCNGAFIGEFFQTDSYLENCVCFPREAILSGSTKKTGNFTYGLPDNSSITDLQFVLKNCYMKALNNGLPDIYVDPAKYPVSVTQITEPTAVSGLDSNIWYITSDSIGLLGIRTELPKASEPETAATEANVNSTASETADNDNEKGCASVQHGVVLAAASVAAIMAIVKLPEKKRFVLK